MSDISVITAAIDVTSAVPSVTVSDIGVSLPDDLDILNGRLSDLSAAMGGGMSTSLTTPQGQIAQSDTAIISDKNAALAWLVNQINPDYSSGRMQDAIGQIYFLDRISALGTTVTATCTGLVGTVIPENSTAQDEAGYLYLSLSSATIGASGSVDVVFQNQATGAIPCPIGDLNTIYRAVNGWSGITNSTAGVLGNDVETRANFEHRRKQSVAKNSVNQLAAIYASVLEVSGVVDAYVTDNRLKVPVQKGFTNFTIPANSVYIAAYGGSQEDIAEAIYKKSPPGVTMVGDTIYTIKDTENYQEPYPEYVVTWQTPTPVSASVRVAIAESTTYPANIIQLIKSAVLGSFNGEDGGNRARIGSNVYASRFYGGIQSVSSNGVNILSVQLSRDGVNYSSSASFGIDEIPTLDESNIEVTIT